jgi:HAD superfamily hydrolase (TIGR01457 family)
MYSKIDTGGTTMQTISIDHLDTIRHKRLFLLDMDGTLYLGNKLIDGAKAFLQELRRQKKQYLYLTNNSAKSVVHYQDKLAHLGIDTAREEFYTSSMAAIQYLKHHHPGQIVYCMGTVSLIEELRAHQITVATAVQDDIGVVLLGYDTELTYQKLQDVCILMQKNLPYIATNPDYVCPSEMGSLPDCGAMAQMLQHATGKMPYVLGKPNPEFLHNALAFSGYRSDEAVLIGDRLYTDIRGGVDADITTVLVLSGETTLKMCAESEHTPDFILPSVASLLEILQGPR